ncbi:MAG: ion transporter [Planctomycetes bacterium]|nr:ion transporter [Planctomycetota bacterium]
MSIKTRTWEIVEIAAPGDKTSKAFDVFILTLIFLNTLAVIVGSVDSVQARWRQVFFGFEVFSVAVFTIEYLLRIWSCITSPKYAKPFKGRLNFAFRPMAMIDLVAILPFYLPFVGVDLRFVRVLRLLRILRVAKIGRYYSSLQLIRNAIRSKMEELILTTVVLCLVLVMASSVMYYCEHGAQPEAFPNIPATMWWAVVTLTTVGYGDVFPVTVLGKIFASVIAISGIGMFALPTGIIGAGFVEEIQKNKPKGAQCPHCGKDI